MRLKYGVVILIGELLNIGYIAWIRVAPLFNDSRDPPLTTLITVYILTPYDLIDGGIW